MVSCCWAGLLGAFKDVHMTIYSGTWATGKWKEEPFLGHPFPAAILYRPLSYTWTLRTIPRATGLQHHSHRTAAGYLSAAYFGNFILAS